MTRSTLTVSQQLERLAGELHSLSFDFEEPSRSTVRSDALIAHVEDVAARIRATVRGPTTAQ